VAKNKIRERYHRLWGLFADAIARCEQAAVYGNSAIQGPCIVAEIAERFVVGFPDWPA
jgi:predicted ABC-type ATPase